MSQSDPVVIVSLARTPMGGFQGAMSEMRSPNLGAHAIKATIERANHKQISELVEEVIMGCVLPAGLGQAPARQAALGAGLSLSTACTTVNKMCGSGMKAIMLAYDGLMSHAFEAAIAGGMESMSNAPYLLPKARAGMRMGHDKVMDHMFLDGLEDAYEPGRLMGTYAEECAQSYQFTREVQDQFAIDSLIKAKAASDGGAFDWEVAPIEVKSRKGSVTIAKDEQPFKANVDKIPTLKPAFDRENGTVTAANSSSISDGAAALLLMRQSKADTLGLKPIAKILGHSSHAQRPGLFTTAPIGAIEKLLNKLNWTTDTPDLYEINEAFAVVTLAAIRDLKLSADKVNVHGGACALGHPIGASGARIVCTLVGALRKSGGKKGVASLCIGGGEATALAIEMI